MSRTFICSTGTSAAKILALKPYREFIRWVHQHNDLHEAANQLFQKFQAYKPEDNNLKYPLSAEIHSLVRMEVEKGDRVLLLASDTDDGYCCALAVEQYLQHYWPGIAVTTERITGLQVTDAKRFQSEGVVQFVRRTLAEIRGYGQSVILNPTGGFKALVPYTVLIGMIKGVECRYIFEQSSTVLDLPPLPVEFQRSRFDAYRSLFEQIERETSITEKQWQDQIPSYEERKWFEPLIESDKNEVTLSAIGLLFLDEVRKASVLVPFISRRAYGDIFDDLNKRQDCNPLERIQYFAANWATIKDTSKNHYEIEGRHWLKPGRTADRYLVSVDGWKFLVWRVISEGDIGPDYAKKIKVKDSDRQSYYPFMRMEFVEET